MKESEIKKTIGVRLRTIRRARRLRQNKVAKLMRMSQGNLNDMESGRNGVSLYRLAQFAAVCGIEPWMILHDDWCNLTGCEDRE